MYLLSGNQADPAVFILRIERSVLKNSPLAFVFTN
jgi:hypothetical protein